MSKSKIAILYEGAKTEKLLFSNINKLFLESTVVPISLSIDMTVYMLWNKMKSDDFETDIIELVRECSATAETVLNDMNRDDFSEVYLFLDHDAHSWTQTMEKADIKKIQLKKVIS